MKKARRPYISDDVMAYGILPCLPAKALVRLQCVSKSWRSLILDDPYFARLQVAHARSSPALLVITKNPEPDLYTAYPKSVFGFPQLSTQFGDQQNRHRPRIMASCKGIFCVNLISLRRESALLLYVGNPVLNDWMLLPPPFADDRFVSIGFAVYEMESGVGYKLVVPFCCYNSWGEVMEVGFKVLSSTKGSWEIVKDRVLLKYWPYRLDSCVTNEEGTLFWEHCEKVIWFDAKEERCGTLSLPRTLKYSGHGRESQLGEWKGHLSYMRVAGGDISIWSWSQSCWSKRLLLTIEAIARDNLDLFASLGLLRMNLRNRTPESLGTILQRSSVAILTFAANFIILQVNKKHICYDARTGKAWAVSSNIRIDGETVFPYVNSLLRLTNSRVAE